MNNKFNEFEDEKNKYKYNIINCDDITYGMNKLHKPIKITSIMEGGKNQKKNCLIILLIIYFILFLIT